MVAKILELLLAVLIVTQVLIPIIRGTPWFPSFRRRYKVVSEIEHAKERLQEAQLEETLDELREAEKLIQNKHQKEKEEKTNAIHEES